MTNQGDKQASCRAISSKALTYNGDWMALADVYGITEAHEQTAKEAPEGSICITGQTGLSHQR